MLTEQVKLKIKNHSFSENGECCGYLFLNNGDVDVEQKKNLLNSKDAFLMENSEYSPIAFYHSHEDSSDFSDLDKIVSERIKLPSVLFNKKNEEFKIYNPTGNRIPYEGRPFSLGYSDCLTLVQDYYKNQLNLDLVPEFSFIKSLLNESAEKELCLKCRFQENFYKIYDEISRKNNISDNWLKKYFELNGFFEVKEPKKNDVILINSEEKIATHCIIFLSQNIILHHPVNRLSRKEIFSDFYKSRINCIMRRN